MSELLKVDRIAMLWIVCVCLLVAQSGCQDSSEQELGDQERIRELVSEISDARTSPDKLSELFSKDAVPDRAWLKETKDRSFVVSSIDVTGDEARIGMELENHFGEVQKSATWQFQRNEDGWVISSAPLD